MLNKWNVWSKNNPQKKYGDARTYQKAADFLKNLKVEDWGCGLGRFKGFHQGDYFGVDRSISPNVDLQKDLRFYKSRSEAIMMRHVLEHNYDWHKVLSNAVQSFQKRMVLIISTPFQNELKQLDWNDKIKVPDLGFKQADIENFFTGLKWSMETLTTNSIYKQEHIYYLEKMVTITYLTAHTEKPEFEDKVKKSLLSVTGNHRLISVSQEPINFGDNICVGKIGHSYVSAYRQWLAGAEAAITDYIMAAESDQFYPPGYYDFIPNDAPIYMYDNLWVIKSFNKIRFYKKDLGDWVSCWRRDYLIKRLKLRIREHEENPKGRTLQIMQPRKRDWPWFSGLPVINIKTANNLTPNVSVYDNPGVEDLAHWGNIKDFCQKYDI